MTAGRDVVVLAEGDPLFYSSYMYLHDRLAERFRCEIVPGVTSVSAASAAAATPLVRHEDVLTVLPGTLAVAELTRRLADSQGVVIMKLGRTFPAVVEALRRSGRLAEARYVERASTGTEVGPAGCRGGSRHGALLLAGPGAGRTTGGPTRQAGPQRPLSLSRGHGCSSSAWAPGRSAGSPRRPRRRFARSTTSSATAPTSTACPTGRA